MKKKDKDFLYRQLINLGDMMGDGLHHEPGGKKEPSKTLAFYKCKDELYLVGINGKRI